MEKVCKKKKEFVKQDKEITRQGIKEKSII